MEGAQSTRDISPYDTRDVQVYLEEKVFPILTDGLEELLIYQEEYEKMKESEEEPGEFRPIFFLAQYLMRHAQNYVPKPQPDE